MRMMTTTRAKDDDDDDDDDDDGRVVRALRALGASSAVRTGRVRARNVLEVVETWDDDGSGRALRAFARFGDAESARALARRDADARRGSSANASASGRRGFVATLDASGVDEEGWSAMHRALHYGELKVARTLRVECANGEYERPLDRRGRAPIDVISEKLARDRRMRREDDSNARRYLHAWGSGANNALGTGSTETARAPARVETLRSRDVRAVATNKVHALAADCDGRLFAWGCSRDGALGLGKISERDQNSAAAVFFPTLVRALGRNIRVIAVSAGLSHSACVTADGDAFTWGCARLGRLGYFVASEAEPESARSETDEEQEQRRWTQWTPRKVPNMGPTRARDVSCGDAHTAILDADGAVWTFGSNDRGQLGYFTACDEGSPHSAVARQVEYLKHRDVAVACVSCSKHHVVVCSVAGDACYSWGNGSTNSRRVVFPKPTDYGVSWHAIDHRVVKVSAGGMQSAAITVDGWVYVWDSAGESLEARLLDENTALGWDRRAVDVSCGATSSVVVAHTGEAYTWDANEFEFDAQTRLSPAPAPFSSSPTVAGNRRIGALRRVPGLRGIASAYAGETHFFAIQRISLPKFSLGRLDPRSRQAPVESDFDRLIRDIGSVTVSPFVDDEEEGPSEEDETDEVDAPMGAFPSLKTLAEHAVANAFIEPRNVLDVAQLADQVGSDGLKRYAMEYALKNLDVVLLETPKPCLEELDDETLEELTHILHRDDIVSGWSESALETQRFVTEQVEDIERAAMSKPKYRAQIVEAAPKEVVYSPPPLASQIVATKPPQPTKSGSRSTPRSMPRVKGSLSMFLSGELQGDSKTPSPPPTQQISRGTPSLREIQEQQSRAAASASKSIASASNAPTVFSPSPSSPGTFSLGDILRRQQMRGTNAWKAPADEDSRSGSPRSMREILAAEAEKAAERDDNFTTTTGFNVRGASPDRWYVEPRGKSKSLREILDEERANEELQIALDAIKAQETAEALAEISKSQKRKGGARRKHKTSAEATTESTPPRAESSSSSRRRKPPNKAAESKSTAPAAASPTEDKKSKERRRRSKRPSEKTKI